MKVYERREGGQEEKGGGGGGGLDGGKDKVGVIVLYGVGVWGMDICVYVGGGGGLCEIGKRICSTKEQCVEIVLKHEMCGTGRGTVCGGE